MTDYSRPDVNDQKIPPYDEIPKSVRDEFNQLPARSKWHRLMVDWFFKGLASLDLKPKPGVDADQALVCLRDLLQRRDIKHEHKVAAFIWLADQWLVDATWQAQS